MSASSRSSSSSGKDTGPQPRQQEPKRTDSVKTGTLFIVATPIGNLGDMSDRARETLASVDLIAAEDTRVTANLLRHYDIKAQLIAYHDHNELGVAPKLLGTLQSGKNVALVSDAGLPLIADPGYRLIKTLADMGITISVIPGANAALAGLILSGLPTDRFYFHGFLPNTSSARQKDLHSIKPYKMTLIFYEAPHRLVASLQDMAVVFGERPAAVARELTKLFEETQRGTLSEIAAHYESHPPKGECVVIVEGYTDNTDDQDIDAMLLKALKTLKIKDAAKAVSAETGQKTSDLYARALELTKDQ